MVYKFYNPPHETFLGVKALRWLIVPESVSSPTSHQVWGPKGMLSELRPERSQAPVLPVYGIGCSSLKVKEHVLEETRNPLVRQVKQTRLK